MYADVMDIISRIFKTLGEIARFVRTLFFQRRAFYCLMCAIPYRLGG